MAEVAIATTIAGLVVAGLAQFSLAASRLCFDSTAKVEMSSDVRMFTAGISRAGRSSRAFYIYPAYASGQVASNRQTDGGSGDLLVFVWIQPGTSNGKPDYNTTHYSRLVGYGRAPDDDGYAPVERFERSFPATGAYRTDALTVEELIDIAFPSATEPPERVVESVRGMAAGERLFSNFRGTSVIVNGQILHGNDARSVTHIYNFTITPRG